MSSLGQTLQLLGADFRDVVHMNRWYHAAGTKDEWEPSARATAQFYSEPGPIATAISLPALLPGKRSIQIELMGMLGEDGSTLPKSHSWPEGSWDWPIHLPYKHGLACQGLGFVGGQVSLDAHAQVIDPDHLDRQVRRSLDHVDRVARGLGLPRRILHLGVYYEIPPGGVAGDAPGAAEIAALGTGTVPAILAGFDYLSYPEMRVEIEAIVELDGVERGLDLPADRRG
jgi:enamine deaminase RidA (YjgF/YER057c/UK114 family)